MKAPIFHPGKIVRAIDVAFKSCKRKCSESLNKCGFNQHILNQACATRAARLVVLKKYYEIVNESRLYRDFFHTDAVLFTEMHSYHETKQSSSFRAIPVIIASQSTFERENMYATTKVHLIETRLIHVIQYLNN